MDPIQLQNIVQSIQAENLKEAIRLCRDVLGREPNDFQALYLLGFAHMRKKDFAQAEKLIGQAIELNSSQPDAHYNRGCALQGLERHSEAIACFDKALLLNPNYIDAEFNRAASLVQAHRLEEAALAFAALIRKNPQDPQAWHNHGDALARLERHSEAVQSFGRALALAPNTIRTLARRANALLKLREFEAAASDYEQIVALDPKHEFAQGDLLYSRLNCCDWRDLERQRKAVDKGLRAGRRIISPLSYILVSNSPKYQRKCAELRLKQSNTQRPIGVPRGQVYSHEKIRVAYVSSDFRNHAVSRLMAGTIEAHDRTRFEIFGVSLGADDESDMRARLRTAFDHFYDANSVSDEEAVAWMRKNEIDIAIDLNIFTGGIRPGIFAKRGAPVQVNYLGFAGTSGSDYLDYILADAVVIPEADRQHYSEKVVSLPNSFQPNDSQRRAAERVPTRQEEGLPEEEFIFCSFNNSSKILPGVFDIWMRLLSSVEGSILWLPQYSASEADNLRREAQARGVGAERIVFAQLVPTPEEYLSRLRLADLFLDTLPYNAHTTASDALWMGVPVLTQIGKTYAARVAASVLSAIGLSELITHSEQEYEQKALEIARAPEILVALKAKLAANRETSALFDTERHCRNLETAFVAMRDRWESGEPADHISVSEQN